MTLTKATYSMIDGAPINVLDFGAKGDGVTDDTVAIQTALDYAIANKATLYFPSGRYRTTATLETSANAYVSIIGVVKGYDGLGPAVIFYDGPVAAIPVLKINVAIAASITGLEIYANRKASVACLVNPDVGGSSYGYRFIDCTFEAATFAGFQITGTSNGARFVFEGCVFYTSLNGFYTDNPNALSHSFIGCAFSNVDLDVDSRGINLQRGSASLYSCEFSGNYVDVYLSIINAVVLTHCWTEQSRRFIEADNNSGGSVTLAGCVSSSFPWSWWKIDESNRTQPNNDYGQWASISFDRNRASLSLIGCQFVDPYNGSNVGSISPVTASGNVIGVLIPNTKTLPINVNNLGSYFQVSADTFTETGEFVVALGVSGGSTYQRALPMVRAYSSPPGQTIFDSVDFSNNPASIYYFNILNNITFTPAIGLVKVGDRATYVIRQNNASANTMSFNNSLVAGGIFSPAVGTGKISSITFEFSGISGQEWIEVGRALDLQV